MNEVESCLRTRVKDCQSIQAIGYKELYDIFRWLYFVRKAIENLKQNSRRYAKRQLTWFRNKMDVKWFDMTEARLPNTFCKKNR